MTDLVSWCNLSFLLNLVAAKAQIPLRRLPRNFSGSFGEVGVMEFRLITERATIACGIDVLGMVIRIQQLNRIRFADCKLRVYKKYFRL